MRIAIIGGGISGLTAAYECHKRGLNWHLYESSSRLGGIIETVQQDGFILEGGPDGWISEKPWARELAIELGLEDDLVYSNDATRKTYLLIDGKLQPIPDSMRMMVPANLDALETSPLFSAAARLAYIQEPARAKELLQNVPTEDESVATFVQRHFGDEVLHTLAAPLLSGVFGGDVNKLSVRAVMPQFVAMEREHGSLIAALQAKTASRSGQPPQPIFTSLRNGVGQLVDALVAKLPPERLHLNAAVRELSPTPSGWLLRIAADASPNCPVRYLYTDRLFLAASLDTTRKFLRTLDPTAAGQLPKDASSAILAALTWPQEAASKFEIPQGFGFLVPSSKSADKEISLLAATFVDQKFPHRAPAGARIIRAFFGGDSADALSSQTDAAIAEASFVQLEAILGKLPPPDPTRTVVRRLPRSLPQYEVGHLERIAALDRRIATIHQLHLLGNAYRGVGIPDLIRDARAAVQAL